MKYFVLFICIVGQMATAAGAGFLLARGGELDMIVGTVLLIMMFVLIVLSRHIVYSFR